MRRLTRAQVLAALDRRALRRTALALGLGAALSALAVVMAVKEGENQREQPAPIDIAVPADPLIAEMRRCQTLGEPGAHDVGCLAAWAENRRRFLAPDRRPLAPISAAGIAPAGAR